MWCKKALRATSSAFGGFQVQKQGKADDSLVREPNHPLFGGFQSKNAEKQMIRWSESQVICVLVVSRCKSAKTPKSG